MGEHSQDSDSGFVAFFIERCIVGELTIANIHYSCSSNRGER